MAGRILTSYVRSAGLPGPGRFIPTPSTPAWLPEGALAYADFENGHYWKGGAECAVDDLVFDHPDYFGTFSAAMIQPGVGLPLSGVSAAFSIGSIAETGFTVVVDKVGPSDTIVLEWFENTFNADTSIVGAVATKIAATFLPGFTKTWSVDGAPVSTYSEATAGHDTFVISTSGDEPATLRSIVFYPPVPDADLPALSALS